MNDVVQLINGDRGKNYPAKDKLTTDSSSGLPFISALNLVNGRINQDGLLFLSEKQYELFGNGKFKKNDIIFCLRGSLGKNAVSQLPKGAIASSLVILRPYATEPSLRYIDLYINSPLLFAEVKNYDNGTAQPNLSARNLAAFRFPLPPLAEQHRIVAKIDALFSKLDKGVETLHTIRQQLRTYRQAVLKWAFEGKNWETKPLRSIVETIFDGPFGSNLKTEDYTDSGIRVIRLENLKSMTFFDEKKSYISFEKYQILVRNTVRYPDLIMGTFISGEIKVCLIPEGIEKAINKADCVCIRTSSPTLSKFLMYYLSSKRIYDSFFAQIHGATRPRVNTTQIKEMLIPVVNTNEKTAIVAAIESRLSVCDKLETIVDESLAKVEALRQSILKKAFAGQLVPQDTNDEPAEKLLERIKAEQKSNTVKTRNRGSKKNV